MAPSDDERSRARSERLKEAARARAESSRFRSHIARAIHFGQRCLERMVEVEFVDRSIALASLTFTSLIPLGVVLGSIAPIDSNGFSDSIVRRFRLEGSTADLVQSLFAPPGDVRQTVSVLGSVLLVASALSFTRGLQRVYERSWRLRSLGVRATPSGLAWLLGIGIVVTIVVPLREAIASAGGPVIGLVLTLAVAFCVWLLTPFVLLSRRVPWRALVPSGILTAIGMTALSAASVVYMPHAIEESSNRYGPIGIAIALVSWFVAAGFVLVGCSVVGAVLGESRAGPWRAEPPVTTTD